MIQMKWWVPMVVLLGIIIIVGVTIWGYKKFGKCEFSATTKSPKNIKFNNQKDAEDAFMDLHNQIGKFCQTVKSPS